MLFRAGGALDAPALIGLALRLGVGAAAAAKSSRKSVFPFRETWFPSPSFSM